MAHGDPPVIEGCAEQCREAAHGQVQPGNTCQARPLAAATILSMAGCALYGVLRARSNHPSAMLEAIGAARQVAMCGMLASAPARADSVPPFKGNDTGGIIAYSLATQADAHHARR